MHAVLTFLLALAAPPDGKKVDRRDESKLPGEIKVEISAFSLEMFESLVTPPPRVDTMAGEIDGKQWDSFSKWLRDHRKDLQFDRKTKRFIVPPRDKP